MTVLWLIQMSVMLSSKLDLSLLFNRDPSAISAVSWALSTFVSAASGADLTPCSSVYFRCEVVNLAIQSRQVSGKTPRKAMEISSLSR